MAERDRACRTGSAQCAECEVRCGRLGCLIDQLHGDGQCGPLRPGTEFHKIGLMRNGVGECLVGAVGQAVLPGHGGEIGGNGRLRSDGQILGVLQVEDDRPGGSQGVLLGLVAEPGNNHGGGYCQQSHHHDDLGHRKGARAALCGSANHVPSHAS